MPQVFSALWHRRGVLASGATIAAAAVTISTLAVLYRGVPTADLHLDDGGVWVTKTNDQYLGHLNFTSAVLDQAKRADSGDFDVLQAGDTVLVADRGAQKLKTLSPATLEWGSTGDLPEAAQVALGGETVGIATGGLLFAAEAGALGSVVFDKDHALAEIGASAGVAVSADGQTAFAVSDASGRITVAPVVGGKEAVTTVPLHAPSEGAKMSVTAVGDQPVALDAAHGIVYRPDGTAVKVAGAQELQQAGAANADVYVTTRTALVRVPLSTGDPQIVREVADGNPASPVWLGGCVYAVWGGQSPSYVRDCAGTSHDGAQALPDATAGTADLVLRTNRRVVVVNDVKLGGVWMISDKVAKVDQWDQVIPKSKTTDDQQDSDKQQHTALEKRDEQNHPPIAKDDTQGVRPGRTVLVRVTDNDTDPDGDLLSAALKGDAPSGYSVVPALDGAALQVAVPASASGQASFAYTVSDGRGGTADATVTLEVHDPSVNGAPEQKGEVATVQVELGGSITYAALDGWTDPDGDDFYLADATTDGGDTITFRPNGVIVFTPASGKTGVKDVTLTVSDGAKEATGTLRVDVRPEGTLKPVANADRAAVTRGAHVTISPLKNDLSPSGQPLRLAQVLAEDGAVVVADYAGGTIDFTAPEAGVYYVQYTVTDGPRAATGLIRVDVSDPAVSGQNPIAVRDVAMLPAGRSVLVDVLSNDTDPTGSVLVVQSARVESGSPVSVEVLEHSVLRVRDVGNLTGSTTFTYTVSNGVGSAVGEVSVVNVPQPQKQSGPVAVLDTATVRAGDVVTVHVLANDYHPDNIGMSLVSVDGSRLDGAGEVFLSEDTIRFHAGKKPGSVDLTYKIQDTRTPPATADGFVKINITPDGANSAPRPKPVIARAVAGSSTRIAIPLDGIDPDGDSVELVGLTSSPALGDVTVQGTWLTYAAYPQAHGTDTFTYKVRDHLGAEASGTVTVGVAPPAAQNQAPYAVDDTIAARPGRQVSIPVTANDSDPDGDQLVGPTLVRADKALAAKVSSGAVLVKTPDDKGTYSLTYRIADVYGATTDGVAIVTVDPDAPLLPPIARDDRVSPLAVDANGTAKVDVRANDSDPDGTAAALTVTVEDSAAKVSGGVVTLPVHVSAQIIRYTVTDPDGGIASAFIFVPGTSQVIPMLSSTKPVEVVSGKTVTIPLADHVAVRPDHSPRVAVNSVSTSHANGEPVVKDATTLVYTSATDYVGPDAIGVLVTDGTGPDDPKGLQGYVSIPISVLPDGNVAPTLRDTSVQVAPNEKPVTIDLGKLAYDANKGDLRTLSYRVDGDVPAGITARVDGKKLLVGASESTTGSGQFQVIAKDVGGLESEPATIAVAVVSSTRELAVAKDDAVIAKAGQTTAVKVLANDHNPFPDKKLKVLSATPQNPDQGTAVVAGDEVNVTPRAGFHGTMAVTYRIADATGAVDREVQGQILATVKDKPDAPTTPAITAIEDSTVVLSWATPANNGAPIDGYRVTSSRGDTRDCTSTTCTITGLTNNTVYTFTVAAHNEVGYSDPSPASAQARPDARPDTPVAPTLAFGDKSLSVSWATPNSKGSPVRGYTLEITPPGGGGVSQVAVTGNSYVWNGLTNGTEYRVRVQAANDAPEPSEWSSFSAPMVPAGVPDAPTAPTTAGAAMVGDQAQIAVSWAAPADNGDTISGYTLSVKRGGSVVQTLQATQTQQNVVVPTSETDYTFSVTATNKAGESAPSADSPGRRAAGQPGAPTQVKATPGDKQATLTFTPGAGNGSQTGELTHHYRVDQTGATGTASPSGTVVGGLANGTSYTFTVWTTSTVSGVPQSDAVASSAVVPFGKPIITLGTITRLDNAVRFTWSVNANGSALTSSSPAVDGSGNGSKTVTGVAAGASTSITVTYGNAAGSTSATWSGQANDPPPPPSPTGYVQKGRSTGAVAGCAGNCNFVNLVAQNLPSGRYTVKCFSNHDGTYGGDPWWTGTVSLSSGTTQLPCWFGFPGEKVQIEVVGQLTTPWSDPW